jgi:hypothetical protein
MGFLYELINQAENDAVGQELQRQLEAAGNLQSSTSFGSKYIIQSNLSLQ